MIEKGHYLFTSESVSEGHPDKVADQISDAILDKFLSVDKKSRVACETTVTKGMVFVTGEITSEAYVDIEQTVRDTIREIGYDKSDYMFDADSCGIITSIHEQSPDIAMGVDDTEHEQGAGDQGIMFGYACNETSDYMPLSISLAHDILKEFSLIRRNEFPSYLRPDAKSQVTIEYDENKNPVCIDTIVLSHQHNPFESKSDMMNYFLPQLGNVLIKLSDKYPIISKKEIKNIHINPTGNFVIGGPAGDTGLTGRKIIVDTYGGHGYHGGGAFSGKDPSKVDRSATYAARHIAKNIVASGIADKCTIQLSYAIGMPQPINIFVDTHSTAHNGIKDIDISDFVQNHFDLTPSSIIKRFDLLNPIYKDTACYGHFGRKCVTENNVTKFPWEKLDCIDIINKYFNQTS